MRWIDMNEKEIIKTWAGEECADESLISEYLSMPDADKESYWCKHDSGEEIKEFGFSALAELKILLERELKEEFYKDLYLPLAVAALKEGGMTNTDENLNDSTVSYPGNDGFSIPDFVYKF